MGGVPLEHVIALSALLFVIGAVGALTRRHWIAILLSIEGMFAAGALAFVAFARVHGDVAGHVFALVVIVAAAAIAVIGLGVVIALYRNRDSMNAEDASLLKW